MALILAKSGTQYVAMVRKLLSTHYRAHLVEYYQAIHHHHLSFHLYLSQCNLLHNLHSLQNVIHRRNMETTRRPIPRTFTLVTWRKTTKTHLYRSWDILISAIILSKMSQSAVFPYIMEARKASKL